MKSRLGFVFLVLLLLLLVGGLVYWLEMPRLVEVVPHDGAREVLSSTSVRLTFSRAMQEESVIDRLNFTPAIQGSYAWEGNTLIFTPAQPWDAGATVQVQLASGCRSSSWLSLAIRQSSEWSFTVRPSRLAFLFPAEGPANVYSWDYASGEIEQLTFSQQGVLDFDVNASGTAVYYSVRTNQGSEIYRQEIRAGASDQFVPEPLLFLSCPQARCRVPVISPGEDMLAYERTAYAGGDQPDYPQVWWLRVSKFEGYVTGASAADAVLAGEPLHQTMQPSWSPTGLLTFYDTNLSAYIVLQPNTTEKTIFPNQTGQIGAWHPNGRDYAAPEILYLDEKVSQEIAKLGSFASSHLILFNRLSGETRDLASMGTVEDASPAFSPDGEYLAFARKYLDLSQWTPGRQIWLMELLNGETRMLTDDPFYHHFELTWSPAGGLLAYVRFNQATPTEPPEVWVMDSRTGQALRVVEGGYAPEWIP